MKVIITPTAKISLKKIIFFLKINWTQREIDSLKRDIKNFKKVMNDEIIIHQPLENFSHIRFSLIGNKQVKILYEIKENAALVKFFWHCKQDPKKLMNILKD